MICLQSFLFFSFSLSSSPFFFFFTLSSCSFFNSSSRIHFPLRSTRNPVTASLLSKRNFSCGKKRGRGKNSTRRHSSTFLGGRSFTGKLRCRNRLMAGGLNLGSFPRVFLPSIVIRAILFPSSLPASLRRLLPLARALDRSFRPGGWQCFPPFQLIYLTLPRSSFVVLSSSHILLTRSAHLD